MISSATGPILETSFLRPTDPVVPRSLDLSVANSSPPRRTITEADVAIVTGFTADDARSTPARSVRRDSVRACIGRRLLVISVPTRRTNQTDLLEGTPLALLEETIWANEAAIAGDTVHREMRVAEKRIVSLHGVEVKGRH